MPHREVILGKNPVREALQSGRRVLRVLVNEAAAEEPGLSAILDLAKERGVPVHRVSKMQLERLGPRPQGVAAELAPFPYTDLPQLIEALSHLREPPLLLAVDSLQDPQNLGALLRTAACTGVNGVILPERRACSITSTVVRVSSGAAEHLLVARVTNLSRALDRLREAGLWVVGLEADGEVDLGAVDSALPVVIVLGGEDRGLGRLVREKCDWVVGLPVVGPIASLNAAVAGSIALYHFFRGRRIVVTSG